MNSGEVVDEYSIEDSRHWGDVDPEFMFPGFPAVVQNHLFDFAMWISDLSAYPIYINRIILVIAIILNVCHAFVLLRKNLRKSSSNVIMCGMAISDMFIAGATFADTAQSFILPADTLLECFAPPSYGNSVFAMVVSIFDDFVRRCSPWLAISLAATRALSISRALDSRYDFLQFSRAGWSAIIISMIASGLLSVFHYFTMSIEIDYTSIGNGFWTPPENCHNFPANYSTQHFDLVIDNILSSYYLEINEPVSKFIPCVAFSILSYILVMNIIRKNEARNKVIKNKTIAKKDRTTHLITFTTVCFLIAEFPQGSFKFVQRFFPNHLGLLMILGSLSDLWNTVEYLNAATHPVVCFLMQAQYRIEVKKVLGIKKNVVHIN